ncbi:hypothetical protein HK098_005505 [Nowakowskiella sp. JEL0407]|nr:hypothetical protein HK098_005505 [Nowakowskiella sp. JEL0407]
MPKQKHDDPHKKSLFFHFTTTKLAKEAKSSSTRGNPLKNLHSSTGQPFAQKLKNTPKLTINPSATQPTAVASGSDDLVTPLMFPICYIPPPPPATDFKPASDKSKKGLLSSEPDSWLSWDPKVGPTTPTNEDMYFDWNGSVDKFETPASSRTFSSDASYWSSYSRSSTPSLTTRSVTSTPSSSISDPPEQMFPTIPPFLASEFTKSLQYLPSLQPPTDPNNPLPPIMFFYTPFLPMFMTPDQKDTAKPSETEIPFPDLWPSMMYPLPEPIMTDTTKPNTETTPPDSFLQNLISFSQLSYDTSSVQSSEKVSPFLPDNILIDSPSICPDQLTMIPGVANEKEEKCEDDSEMRTEARLSKKAKRADDGKKITSTGMNGVGGEGKAAKENIILGVKKPRTIHPAIYRYHKLDLHNQESTIQSSLNFARDSTTEQKMKPEKQIRYMNLFTSETEHPEIKRVLESCEGPPELEKFDKFQIDGVKSLHMFTYPQYFLEEWTKTMLSEYTDTQNKRQLKHSKTRQSKRVNRQSLKTGEIKEIFVKRYNSEGEVVGASKSGDTGGSGSPSEGKPGKSVKLVNNDSDTVNSGLLSPDRPTTTEWSKQLSIPSQPTQNPGSIQQSFAPPPPPPPLPPTMTQSSVNGGGGKKSEMGSEARKEEKSALPIVVTRKEEKSVENRHNLLNDIRNSQFKLRKVGIQEQETRVKKNEGGVDGVAAILMRRAALEMSDSEESDGEDEGDDDWN